MAEGLACEGKGIDDEDDDAAVDEDEAKGLLLALGSMVYGWKSFHSAFVF